MKIPALYLIYITVLSLSVLICLIYFNILRKQKLGYFLPFLTLTLCVELVGLIFTLQDIQNYMIFNIFTTIEFVFYAYMFHRHIESDWIKKIILLFIPLYVLAVIINLTFIQGTRNFHSYTFLIGSFFIVSFCCLFFYESVLPEHLDTPLTKQPFFWVCTGLLLFYLGSVIINALFEYLRSFDMQEEGKRIYGIINQSLNVVLYSAFTFAFLLCRNNSKTYSLPS
ncbi:MAG: hypothetical protein EAZ62_05715 [Sphingobacteriia bacterium]|nr:MAG: hypothetical protein EAZ62_05715 [Sphingobacteriia bacterium]